MSKKQKEFSALHHGEEKLQDTENGYLFHCGDGNVKYRSNDEHEQVLESRNFEEPAPRTPQTLAQTLGHA